MSRSRQIALGFICCASTLALPQTVLANPVDQSCQILKVIGDNDAAAVTELVETISDRWSEESRQQAVGQLTNLASAGAFAGGSLYRLSKLGDDLEDHLILLRLRQGGLSAMWLRYEAGPGGMRVGVLDINRRVSQLVPDRALGMLEPVECP